MPRLRPGMLICALLPDLLVPAAASAQEVGDRLSLEDVLGVLEELPPATRVQGWAVAEARADPEAAGRLVKDARARGALPLVRVRGRFDQGEGTRWDHLNLQDQRDEDSGLTLDLWLEWDLGDLASGPDVLRAVRESRELVELRHAVIAHVTITYFDRKRLRAEELLAPPNEPVMRSLERRLRLQELDATLDGLTGGRWTASLPLSPQPGGPAAAESARERTGQHPDPGLRLPVHPADRPSDSGGEGLLRDPPVHRSSAP